MNLSMFLAENAVPAENIKYVASTRFLGDPDPETGERKPMEWEIRPLTSQEDEAIRKTCRVRVPIRGRRGQYQQETDNDAYVGKLAAACTVFPNLKDAELQNSYHVMGEDALLKAMLTNGEYAAYLEKVQEVCGFDLTFDDEVDTAKN